MKEIQKIYLFNFLAGLSTAASVTFTLYFLSHGLTQANIGQLFGFFLICIAVFDIPTGGIADTFGHKSSVALGLFLQAISFLCFFLYPTYGGFLLGMFMGALGLAFQSGATSSLIYELLQKEQLHEDFQKVSGKATGYFLVASIFASPIGSVIYTYYPSAPYFLSFVFFLFASITVFLIKWEFTKKTSTIHSYVTTIGQGMRLTLQNRILLATTLIGIGLTVNRLLFNQNINQPYQVSVGIDVAYIGVIAAIVAAVQAIVSIYAYKISKKLGKIFSLLLIILIPSIALISLSFIHTLLAIPFLLIFCMGHAFRDPVITHIEQEQADPDTRSTMASTTSFLVSISAGILLPFWGKGIDLFGIQHTLFLLGVFSLSIGLVGLSMYQYKSKVTIKS